MREIHDVKTYNRLVFLCRNLKISPNSIKEQAYKSIVRLSLEFACSVI